ncbi:MAG TPA: hypothetical protein VHZ96_26430 [Frankiaceae bacterium]|nr:hypothetical protein [Frankiaceae bacterium]
MRKLLIVAAALLLAACSSSSSAPAARTSQPPSSVSRPAPIQVAGTLTMAHVTGEVQGSSCQPGGGYHDIRPGAEVVISDDAGHTLAITQLGQGQIDNSYRCRFKFAASVPAGKHFYGVEVTHRGVVKFAESELGHAALTLGT